MKLLPEKTVERLSAYRRTLLNCLSQGKSHIYSHELAKLHHITAVQVRRDIMFIGYSSLKKKGYNIKELIRVIGRIVDSREVLNVAIIGMGNYGKAISAYFKGKRPMLDIVAAFDVDSAKVGSETSGIHCYDFYELKRIISEKNISIAILTVPPDTAEMVKDLLVDSGIRGILNFTSVLLKVPDNVYLEEYDMITSLEKVAYFVKKNKKR